MTNVNNLHFIINNNILCRWTITLIVQIRIVSLLKIAKRCLKIDTQKCIGLHINENIKIVFILPVEELSSLICLA